MLTRLPPIAAIVALACLLATGNYSVAQPLVLLAIMLAPALLPRSVLYPGETDSPPDSPNDDGGGGRGPTSDPPAPPAPPGGGIPLPDAAPARVRVRDHDRLVLTPRPARRAPREPEPAPRRRRLPAR
ncbi:MAG: hypothetical protein JO304_00240 [Solirubrobacterales bacterium]|nr:hypothetical protein [Solirubrobacterales bacterium]